MPYFPVPPYDKQQQVYYEPFVSTQQSGSIDSTVYVPVSTVTGIAPTNFPRTPSFNDSGISFNGNTGVFYRQ